MDLASYITGFVDGEGCFSVSFTYRPKLTLPVEVRPSFAVAQNERSRAVLEQLQDWFKCGSIRYSKNDQTFKYEVRSVGELAVRVIPHFERYPLWTAKKQDFELWRSIVKAMEQKQHLEANGLQAIIAQAYAMNISGKRRYQQSYLLRRLTR